MKKNNLPAVRFDGFELSTNEYNDGINVYHVFKLIDHSKKFGVFNLPLAGIDISRMPWTVEDIKSFVHHYDRIRKADLSKPIILDSSGYICDGWHRLCKAISKGKKTIKAIRLESMPEPDRPAEKKEN